MYATLLLSGLAMPFMVTATTVKNNPGPPPKGYQWNVTNWEAHCSISGGCSYTFNVTGPTVSSTYPDFPGFIAGCKGTDNNKLSNCYLYQTSIPIGSSDHPQVLSSITPNRDSGSTLTVKLYESVSDTGYPAAYTGNHVAPITDGTYVNFAITGIDEAEV